MSNSELKSKKYSSYYYPFEHFLRSTKGKWGQIIPVILLYSIITGIISFYVTIRYGQNPKAQITGGSSIVSSIITAFFVLGYNSFFLKLSRNQDVEVKELWSKTGQFIRAFVATFLIGLVVGLGLILLIIPGIIFALMFSMTMFIMIDDKNISPIDAMKKSAEMMKGHKRELLSLIISFFGWLIIGVFTLFILYLWLIPYMNTAICNFYDSIKE